MTDPREAAGDIIFAEIKRVFAELDAERLVLFPDQVAGAWQEEVIDLINTARAEVTIGWPAELQTDTLFDDDED